MILFNYRNLNYGLSITTFVSGSADRKIMGRDGSSKSHVVMQPNQPLWVRVGLPFS